MTSPSRPGYLGAWALAYASELGWPVFPLVPRNKTPLTRNGLYAASIDTDRIDRWWTAYPDANIGLRTGETFDVLDIDGEDGATWLARYLGDAYRHDGPVSMTGKGWHLLFRPTGLPNGTNLGSDPTSDPSKIDFRGTGGYIVAPPSIHPAGHRYTWDPDRGPRSELPVAPDWLRKLLNRDDNPRGKTEQLLGREPNQSEREYQALLAARLIPDDQLPSKLRVRAERPNILDVCARKNMPLRARHGYYVTRCIFHDDSTPSLTIYTRDNTFHCFGCGAHGDSIDLERDTYIGR